MKLKLIALTAIAGAMFSCTQPQKQSLGLSEESFGTVVVDDKEVKLYTLANANGMTVQFTNIGAKVVTLFAPDKNGVFADVVQGYATAAEYAACDQGAGKGEAFLGATIGRYGNRIANATFAIGEETYQLDVNEGANHLHGGSKGFHSVVWDANKISDQQIEFTYVSPDGEMGYPGTLTTTLTYKLTDDNSLVLEYKATTDKATVVNLTHHSFFNLAGEDAATINDHVLTIAADFITPVDDVLIPTGDLMPVEGTAFDFNTARVVGDSLASQHPQMVLGNGYDHNWVLSSEAAECGIRFAAKVQHPQSGRTMEVLTTEPGIQFYGGNFINGTQTGKCGKAYPFRSALCLETQHFPDSPNKPEFPSTVLNPDETYSHVCIYKFTVE